MADDVRIATALKGVVIIMELGIAGKWALVCGASKGLGFGCAQALVREGVHVVMVARGAEALEEAVARLIAEPARPSPLLAAHTMAFRPVMPRSMSSF